MSAPHDFPAAMGVGRDAENPKAVSVYFERELRDDELRALHDLLAMPAFVSGQTDVDALALSSLRRVLCGWHERAVALGTDGVADVLHDAEVRARRGSMRLAHDATRKPEPAGFAGLTVEHVGQIRDFLLTAFDGMQDQLQAHARAAGVLTDGAPEEPPPMAWFSNAARDVLAERRRQVEVEGNGPEHDDTHDRGELALAAAAYLLQDFGVPVLSYGAVPLLSSLDGSEHVIRLWPWELDWWKPKSRRRNLERAGALILAEIERLDRATAERMRVESSPAPHEVARSELAERTGLSDQAIDAVFDRVDAHQAATQPFVDAAAADSRSDQTKAEATRLARSLLDLPPEDAQ